MKLLTYLFRNSPYIATLAMLTALVSGIGNASLITLIHAALNRQAGMGHMGWQFAGLALFALVTSVISQSLLSYLYRKSVFDWQIRLSRDILQTSLRQLESVGGAELFTVLVEDVTAIGGALVPMLPFCTNIVVVLICLSYLCWLSWKLFLGFLLVLLLGAITYHLIWQRSQALLKLARSDSGQLYGHFRLMIDGIKELKLHHDRRQAFFSESLQPVAARRQRRFFFWGMLHALNQAWAKFLLLFVMGMILFVFPSLIEVTPSILTGYILTLLYIRSMLFALLAALPAFAMAEIAFQKIEDLGIRLQRDDIPKIQPLSSNHFTDGWQHLELVDVSHTYYREREESHFTLGPINLKFTPGELVFLVGGNGSGKTTLAKLITGLYTPEAGAVYLNGECITHENRESYLQLFSVVFADFQLFNDLLGLKNPQIDAQAQQYLVQLQLDHKVSVQNGQLSTMDLSGGQRQRLALLTAYLEDRPFYIFDEWAANQDPVFKEIFYTQFLPALTARGKTVLVISHDDQYFKLANRIIKLDYGKLAVEHCSVESTS
ncbi:cyclic peptide export ABC transporter [filamentous cyanobacterium LEGE 11480]|uniref:Cyclic peptide export ABC transporter n=1 Tax=Romeriopsis navalis LEGE 11480 TaxID=2777977 RepID=A0A928Z208_9CYAN|nr:cyclic peptide export ABC transporter [Romeriopsis navalis]MBE9029044.1 cyclic peptide export ABC transporter [Romeriopsis navalis LEGE 11480]